MSKANISKSKKENLFQEIRQLLENAKNKVVQTVNTTMVLTYFEIGRLIVEDEQMRKFYCTYSQPKSIPFEPKIRETLSPESGEAILSFQNRLKSQEFYFSISHCPIMSV